MRPPLRGLGLVAKDEVELVLIARALPARLGALVARRLRLVTLLKPSALLDVGPSACTEREWRETGYRGLLALILLVLHIWQPREGFPQYTMIPAEVVSGLLFTIGKERSVMR